MGKKIEIRCPVCHKLLFKASHSFTSTGQIQIRCTRCSAMLEYPTDAGNEFPDVIRERGKRQGPQETKRNS